MLVLKFWFPTRETGPINQLFRSISLNFSSCTILVEIFPNALKSETTSFLVSARSGLSLGKSWRGLCENSVPRSWSKSPENKIFRAVPRPVTWTKFCTENPRTARDKKKSLKVIQLVESRPMHKNNGLPATSPTACTYHSQHSPSLLICSGNVLGTPA